MQLVDSVLFGSGRRCFPLISYCACHEARPSVIARKMTPSAFTCRSGLRVAQWIRVCHLCSCPGRRDTVLWTPRVAFRARVGAALCAGVTKRTGRAASGASQLPWQSQWFDLGRPEAVFYKSLLVIMTPTSAQELVTILETFVEFLD